MPVILRVYNNTSAPLIVALQMQSVLLQSWGRDNIAAAWGSYRRMVYLQAFHIIFINFYMYLELIFSATKTLKHRLTRATDTEQFRKF